ncbi:hypothetical protein [Kordiimonas sp.]|uniref:hypothetical protein n=1 Tax=Kordiimonas sp. TaxID=1970157 RepID=UPI003A94A56E
MHSIDHYVDRALAKKRFKSDRQLSTALGLSLAAVGSWRTRRAIPSEESMVKLAEFAGMDAEIALLELGWWRSVSRNEHAAATTYQKLIAHHAHMAA